MDHPDLSAINTLTVLMRARRDALTVRWVATTLSIGACALIVAWFEQGRPKLPFPVTVVFWLISFGIAAYSLWLPHKELTDRVITRWLTRAFDPQASARAMKLSPEQSDSFATLPALDQRLFSLTLLFEEPYTQALKLSGALAFLGLVYGVVAGTLVEASPALLGGLALNCYHYPWLTSLLDRGRVLANKAEDEELVSSLSKMKADQPEAEPQPQPQRKSVGPAPGTPPLRKARKR